MSVLIMILLLSLLILVHEAGHFLVARACGIKVDKFGFGLPFGPTLFKTKIGDVEVLIHAFLLGGYVSFPDDDKDSSLPKDSPERFSNRPVWQRIAVVIAGVVANVICAYFLVMAVAIYSKQLPSGTFDIWVSKVNNEQQSILKDGDKILKANGCDINNLYSLITIVKNSAKDNGYVSDKIFDENLQKLKNLNPALQKDEIIPENLSIRLPKDLAQDVVTMDEYQLKGAKYYHKVGNKINDDIQKLSEELEGKKVYTSNGKYTLGQVAQALSDNEHPVVFTIERDNKILELNPIYPNKQGAIGISLKTKEKFIDTKTPISIIKESYNYLYNQTHSMVYSLGQLFTGNIPAKDLHGVVAITKIGGDIINERGATSGILLAALISMNLALLNILPIPALDGGHLMFLLIEKITGRPVNEKVVEIISNIFFGLLIILMILVIFNDITLLIKK